MTGKAQAFEPASPKAPQNRWNKSVLATISCVASEFLQQSPFDRDEYLSKLEKPSAEIFTYQHNGLKEC
jgi:hypothetical protein